MRHRRAGHKLGRTSTHRTATLRNLAAGLIEHGQITTTVHKAKAVQPFVEKLITLAKRGDLHSRRLVIARLRDRVMTGDESAVERNRYGELRKGPKLIKHLFEEVAPRFADRPGGYTRIVKLGKKRIGDKAELCVLQLCGDEDGPEIGGRLSHRRRIADKRTAYAAKLRKGFAAPAKKEAKAEPAPETPAESGGE
ncbi:MAG: 50S ribosomal protein L17 [Phycisphaeraceae bacterium]|nr:50S ribosomal protein L17 [Phycisphaeraceae bacterium]MCB9847302.1 50S ribosomal protein L17 [Phycisphaeraceae bacterium]